MPDNEHDGGGAPSASQAAGGLLDGATTLVKNAGEPMLEGASKGARFILKRIPGAPALVYDVADLATAPDKLRSAAGIAGGLVGGAAGEVVGGPGIVTGPILAAAGSAYGQKVGEDLYDAHSAQIHHALDATKQWVKQRTAQAAGALNSGLDTYGQALTQNPGAFAAY